MAETHEEVPGAGGANRTLLWIMLSVVVLFIAIGLLMGKKKEEQQAALAPPPPSPARALGVPSDARRTVIVAPCGTDPDETARDARQNEPTPGSVRFDFPRGGEDRFVMVPDCTPQAGVSGGTQGIPAAAFILPAGVRDDTLQTPPIRAESQGFVPTGSNARTLVISPCTGELGGEAGRPSPSRSGGQNQDFVLVPEGKGDVAVAEGC